ncbi:MAG TPA: hypothetical protein VF459_11520 [Caulobacteraceae bacterium]
MPFTRSIATETGASRYAMFLDDRSWLSVISKPGTQRLIFDEAQTGKPYARPAGGEVASGVPVALLFWGEWWNQSQLGLDRQAFFIDAAQKLIASRYFEGLGQYGVEPPTYWGARVVTDPGPPADPGDNGEIFDMLDGLVDDTFPDPDDQLLLPVIFLPPGATQVDDAGHPGRHGSHHWGILDDHRFIFALIKWYDDTPLDSLDMAMRTVSHEIVEAMTDPWSNAPAWRTTGTPPAGGGDEIADEAEIPDGPNPKRVQSAFVNGVTVCAYWSNEEKHTVIPIDLDYSAQIAVEVQGISETAGPPQTFRPDPGILKLCPRIADRPYSCNSLSISERAICTVKTTRYRKPRVHWTVGDQYLEASRSIAVHVVGSELTPPDGVSVGPHDVTLDCVLSGDTTTLTIIAPGGLNFDVPVSCWVHDDTIQGLLAEHGDVNARPETLVGFAGSDVALDPEYTRALEACLSAIVKAALDRTHRVPPEGPPGPPEPGEVPGWALAALPAYARLTQFRKAQQVVRVSRAAQHLFERESASAITRSLVARAPALAATLQRAEPPLTKPV